MLGLSFAFYQLWLYMAIFSAPKAFHPDTFLPQDFAFPEPLHGLLVYSFLAVSALLLIGFSIFAKKLVTFFYSNTSIFLACILMFLGTSLLFVSAIGAPVVFLSALLMGIGTALLVILFGIIFSRFDFATCVLNASLAFALGFIGADALTNWVPSPISGIFACLMPLLLLLFLLRNKPLDREETEGEIPLEYVRPYITRLAISMAFLGLIVGALRVVCGDKLLSSGDISMELVLGVGCMASVAVLVFAIALSKRTELWDSLLRNVTPIIMLGIAGIAFLAGDAKMFAAFFTIIGFACVVSVTWILLASFARNLNGSHIFVFGLGYGVIQAASIIGVVIANFLSSQGLLIGSIGSESLGIVGFSSQVGLSDLAILLMVVFSAGYTFLPRYRELKEILASLVVALSSQRELDETVTTPSEMETPSKDGLEADEEPITEPELIEKEDQEPVQDLKDPKGSFTRRCDEISDQYSLSAREREAFFYLAKGHNAAYLTEQLCISRSTAKTHINHIYKKLGIHTQQELLNMVEDRQRGPIGASVEREAIQDALRRAKEEGPLESNPSDLVEHIQRDIR